MKRVESLFRGLAPLLLVLVILAEARLSLAQDARNHSLPPETHHQQYLTVRRLAREIEGWAPVDPKCAPWNCNAGFDLPPEQATPEPFVESTRWLWDQGDKYPNRSPLHGLPSAALVVLFPGSAAVAALGLRFWFAILLFGVYQLGCMARGPLTGLLAAVLTAGTPGLFATAQLHADTTALGALGTWLVVAILASDALLRLRWAFATALLTLALYRCVENASNMFGVWMGLIAPAMAALIAAVVGFRRDRRWRRLVGFVLVATLPIGITIHYLRDESTMTYIRTAVSESHSDWLGQYSLTHVPQLAFFEELARNLVRLPLLAFVLLGLLSLVRSPLQYRWVLLGSFCIPLAGLTYIGRLGTWYFIPAIPVMMCASAIGLGAIRWAWVRVGVAVGGAAAAMWMRWSMVYAPKALMSAAIAAFPNVPALTWLDVAIGPRTVFAWDNLHGRITRAEGAAAMAIAGVAREMGEGAGPAGRVTRVIILSDSQHREFATCWVITLEVPRSTCLGGVSGWYTAVPNALWEPDRYDLVAWVDQHGLRELSLDPNDELPQEIRTSLDRINPAEQVGPRALLEHLRDLSWQPVAVSGGTVHRRIRP